MEETTIVIMLKDEETGFLDQELGSYSVPERAELIWSIYVKSNEVVLRLSCDRELEDWEYEAVFDYYDTEPVGALVDTIIEEEGHCDPVWIVGFPFIDDQDAMEGKLAKILQAHEKELRSVFDEQLQPEQSPSPRCRCCGWKGRHNGDYRAGWKNG